MYTGVSRLAAAALALGVVCAGGCSRDDDDPRFRGDYVDLAAVPAPLPEAYCEILVEGVGVVDMETDYLPHVVACENGGAEFEALKAQAVAARSVAYYYVAKEGSVCDSQGCQVYSCNNQPSEQVYQAVLETSGLYMHYNDTLTYTFYVAGDNQTAPPSCVGAGAGTESFVTYNEGLSGDDVEQTSLGWVFEPGEVGYGQNRGCMSQWGARCLENELGYGFEDILRFYYGEDTVLAQAQGECVMDAGDSGDADTTDTTDATDEGGIDDEGDTEACPVGALGCPCTEGGGCDPGLVCEDGICSEADPSDADETDDSGEVGDELGGETNDDPGGFNADAFEVEGGCACGIDSPGRDLGGAALGLLGLLALRRRRPR